MRFGVQTALSNTTPDELRPLWRHVEALGFDWISIWDHFHAVGGGTRNLEAVAMHTALALETSRVRCGGLVYSVGYRSLAVLANAAAAIDQLSGGRVTLGLGAGYLRDEYVAWGLDFPSARDRLDRLEETVPALRALFAGDTVTLEGRHVQLREAACDPPPAQAALPIWVGGGGERRTLPLAGRLADGWNVPMATVDDFARKAAIVAATAADAGRDPAAVERSVGVGLCWDEARLGERFGARAEALRPSILTGSTQEVVDRVAAYREAGADWLFLSLRAPFDHDEVERFATEVVPVLS
ncbi:MAG TPA: LLM class flavin-dependent oxidoreductase [Acidimicrobiales bacterium]|nr:LLM class flavin-dependent oxidoreductase [Acidimicrobiales bacterium]